MGRFFTCQFSLNEDGFLHLNSFSLLVEVSPSSRARFLNPSTHLNQLHREASKQQQRQKTPSLVDAAEWGVSYGSETARAIRKHISMGAEFPTFLVFLFRLEFFPTELKILCKHPAE